MVRGKTRPDKESIRKVGLATTYTKVGVPFKERDPPRPKQASSPLQRAFADPRVGPLFPGPPSLN